MAFVGRARELDDLERALGEALSGRGAAILVAAEAGIGKTRLAAELAAHARAAGVEVLLGRSIELAGTELPYQPLVDALRPLGEVRRAAVSQLQVFEQALALLSERAPVLLVLEDLHWADTSTLDLVVFLAHNLADRRVLMIATYRPGEERMRRVADSVRRADAALLLELGPLADEDVTAMLAGRSGAAQTRAIVARAEGNPFFAEELLGAGGELPRGLRELLLARFVRLDPPAQGVLRLAAAAGREVSHELLRALAQMPEPELREALRRAVEHGVLVAEPASYRFRHALLAEAVYATILPGEREELHGRLADALTGAAPPAELARHWAAAGRHAEAFAASVEAARAAEAVFGLPEALAHLERALALWPDVPDPGLDLGELCTWTAELAGQTGAAPRAVELVRRAIALGGESDPLLHERLARYLHWSGRADLAFAAAERAVELAPPGSAERAEALAGLANHLMLDWRFEEALPLCEEALAMGAAELPARMTLGSVLAYLGRGEEGLAELRRGLELADGDPPALQHAYIELTDALLMLGRPRESARVAAEAYEALRRSGLDDTTPVANWVEALVACGEWDQADRISAAAVRAITANYPHMRLIARAELEVGRGDFDAARAHLDAARTTLVQDREVAIYDTFVAELALWERRWTDAEAIVSDGLERTGTRDLAQLRVWLCAKGLRAQAELAALARARRDTHALPVHLARADTLLADARRAATQAAGVTPNVAGWLSLAEAEHDRAQPQRWSAAAETWERLERPPLAAYCRWRQAEALVAAGAPRAEAAAPLRAAHAVAGTLRARPLLRELQRLAERARLDLTPLDTPPPRPVFEDALGLTPREAEVLALVARGLTNREIAAALVISVKTASVHVSHILRKLDAPNRLEAAAIAHRLAP